VVKKQEGGASLLRVNVVVDIVYGRWEEDEEAKLEDEEGPMEEEME